MHELSNVCCQRDPIPDEQRKAIEELLNAGADVHAADKNGVTALHHAVWFRSLTAVATLLERRADVNQPVSGQAQLRCIEPSRRRMALSFL